jgi:hypothetical protein
VTANCPPFIRIGGELKTVLDRKRTGPSVSMPQICVEVMKRSLKNQLE